MNALKAMAATMLLTSSAGLLAQPAPTNNLPPSPTEVALIDHADTGFIYNRFPTGERLYIYDADPVGQSMCNSGCDSAWPPVLAPANAKPIGNWTIITRGDGSRQWALAGKPVYSRYHDLDGAPNGWRILSGDLAKSMTLRQ